MAFVLGLDPSVAKSGYCVVDSEAPYGTVVESGKLTTSQADGSDVLRYLAQKEQLADLMAKYDIKFVTSEKYYLGGRSSDLLFALHMAQHTLYYDLGTYVVWFPPQTLKSIVIPKTDLSGVGKNHMVILAQETYNCIGKALSNDVADAMHIAHLGKVYYQCVIEKSIPRDALLDDCAKFFPDTQGGYRMIVTDDYIKSWCKALHWNFFGKKELSRGPRKGETDYHGVIYRENELFIDYSAVKRRRASTQERSGNKEK